ncbi:MAG: hypothetical protein KKA05_00325 [Alphaproteobacteria bacterium]|nr:hypothetical protein [Alphaproteobacteria bacterium]MBU0859026.1 hypothetical protein [Alphaproteobacteria bacterium]
MTSLQEELQSTSITMAPTGDPGNSFNARIAAGMVEGGFKPMMEPAAPSALHGRFNQAEAGIQAQGHVLQAAGPQVAAPVVAPENQPTPVVQPTAPGGMGMG